jgi:alpha-beta hydrolase superfamily lysophospholipase
MYVVSIRLPGNGTIPSGLRDAKLEDWLAVTAMGVKQVRSAIGPALPIYIAGYSIGGALALNYTLDAVGDDDLEKPDRLFFFSPAIGVTPAARLSRWDLLLSNIPAFRKFSWLTVEPEFDPYKYNSFAKNAGHITYLLTESIRTKISKLDEQEALSSLPPVISFQSLVDSTVRTSVLVDEIYSRLPNNGSELVIYDINRAHDIETFLHDTDEYIIDNLAAMPSAQFSYTLITNASAATTDVVSRTRRAGETDFTTTPLDIRWPATVYSMSHVALPFAADDLWYGNIEGDVFALGAMAPRGEVSALTMPIGRFMRLRYNPFFYYQAARMLQFCAACAE